MWLLTMVWIPWAASRTSMPRGPAMLVRTASSRLFHRQLHGTAGEVAGVQVAEEEAGVGDGRLGAAHIVGRGPGEAPALRGPTLKAPLPSTQAMLPPPAPMVFISSIGWRRGYFAILPSLDRTGLPLSTREMSQLVPPMSRVMRSMRSLSLPAWTPPITPAAGPERTVDTVLERMVSSLVMPPREWMMWSRP